MRRGAEREIHDLGVSLTARGHRVGLVTTTPDGVLRRADVDGVRVTYVRQPVPGGLQHRGWTTETLFAAPAAVAAATSRADVVQAFLYGDAAGVGVARRVRRVPLVLKLTGTVRRQLIEQRRVDAALFRRALDAADEVWCNSRFAVEEMAEFGVPMRIVPAGVDETLFRPRAPRHDEPVVLCASAPGDPRKRLVDLFDAWPEVRAVEPAARLRIAGAADEPTRAALLDRLPAASRESVTFLGSVADGALAEEYSRAWVTAAPAVYEALGLTTLESLACGTPVAGARSGATAELLARDGVGTTFEPADPAGAAEAILAALDLADRPDTRERCRQAALPYAWPEVTSLVLERYRALLGG